MRVLQLRDDLDLPPEPVEVDPSELGVQHLHDDLAIQRALARQKNPAHPSAPELPLDGKGFA